MRHKFLFKFEIEALIEGLKQKTLRNWNEKSEEKLATSSSATSEKLSNNILPDFATLVGAIVTTFATDCEQWSRWSS